VIRILLVDDDALIRAGLRLLLETQDDLTVIGEAGDGAVALGQVSALSPDVVLMDIQMPHMDGLEATERISASGHPARILMLTTFEQDEYVFRALRAGASGFVLKRIPPEELIAAIRTVADGEALLSPSVTKRLITAFAKQTPPTAVPPLATPLTDRELEVLRLLARGLSNAEIAEHLVLSALTVKTHVGNLLMKLQLRDRTQAVVYAYEAGLVAPGAAGHG
jgi:DNA-binding NarL/FixJ family response regulator